MLFNKENQTSLDISVSSTERTQLVKWSFKWNLGHCRLGRRDFEIKWKKIQKPEDETESRENTAKKDIMEATRIHLVVATLLVTVTFAAGYTLPGGFESDLNSSTKGMAILIRETAFRAFVVSDDIAFTCSACAVFCYFFIVVNTAGVKKLVIITALSYSNFFAACGDVRSCNCICNWYVCYFSTFSWSICYCLCHRLHIFPYVLSSIKYYAYG
ncbi:uncharacterized protein LOC107849630 isoform X1 [Capsicum annuum]|uniref:uncharacterized protein LOC107849630 isoform X1 n=1 Tax=Capsicum annuum TaxID=4072 RepID=UPI001FB15BCE|nr:uncharacterized protein LOC107849630 isoform X1 [Capsicum annuum]